MNYGNNKNIKNLNEELNNNNINHIKSIYTNKNNYNNNVTKTRKLILKIKRFLHIDKKNSFYLINDWYFEAGHLPNSILFTEFKQNNLQNKTNSEIRTNKIILSLKKAK